MSSDGTIRRFHVWNEDRVYRGIVTRSDNSFPNDPYYKEIPAPECPSAPKREDGWYLVYHRGYADEVKQLRQLRDGRVYDVKGELSGRDFEFTYLIYFGEDITFLPDFDRELGHSDLNDYEVGGDE